MRFAIFLCLIATSLSAEPVSVAHKYGVSVVPSLPQRIVSVGYHEQDFSILWTSPLLAYTSGLAIAPLQVGAGPNLHAWPLPQHPKCSVVLISI